MNDYIYSILQLREIFHIEFLRRFARKIKSPCYAVKGGTNLRLFFKSFRYSEDMDLDLQGVKVHDAQDIVMEILQGYSFLEILKPFGIAKVILPDMTKAKQTETTQRFKVHLMTYSGEDLFTKIEFSRRGFNGSFLTELVPDAILRAYKIAPLIVSHYDIRSAIAQKIMALATRAVIQARDIFDLYILSSQYILSSEKGRMAIENSKAAKAHENIFEIGFDEFRDTVVSYLSADDQSVYSEASMWDEIKLKTAQFITEIQKSHG